MMIVGDDDDDTGEEATAKVGRYRQQLQRTRESVGKRLEEERGGGGSQYILQRRAFIRFFFRSPGLHYQ